jgi:hypothetical protein
MIHDLLILLLEIFFGFLDIYWLNFSCAMLKCFHSDLLCVLCIIVDDFVSS